MIERFSYIIPFTKVHVTVEAELGKEAVSGVVCTTVKIHKVKGHEIHVFLKGMVWRTVCKILEIVEVNLSN